MIQSFGGQGDLGLTAAANTRIQRVVPPLPGAVTRVTRVTYTPGNVSHTLTFLRPIGRTTANATSAANTNTVTLVADPGPSGNGIAANDYLALRETDGVTRPYQVSAWNSTTLVVTLVQNLTAGMVQGSKVWDFGATTDTNPTDGRAHPTIPSGTNTAITLPQLADLDSVLVATLTTDDPVLFDSNNINTAATLTQISWSYAPPTVI